MRGRLIAITLAAGCRRAESTQAEQNVIVSDAAASAESNAETTAQNAPTDPAAPSDPKTTSPTTTIENDKKRVKTDGKNVALENETGKGSVSTSGRTTTVTGKSGKSVAIPLP